MSRSPAAPASSTLRLAQGEGWQISDVRCRRGPEDRPFEEQHRGVSLALVLSGTFAYRSCSGRALLYPGAMLLGNAGACFECGHEHGRGDHCLALGMDAGQFAEIAAGRAQPAEAPWPVPSLPALPAVARAAARLQTALRDPGGEAVEESVLAFAADVVDVVRGAPRTELPLRAHEQRRLSEVVRYLELHSHETQSLIALARMAHMSRFHFLRRFRRAFGVTPHQYLLGLRLARAAQRLLEDAGSIADAAFASGFGDLSTFSRRFRTLHGLSPGAFRALGCASARSGPDTITR